MGSPKVEEQEPTAAEIAQFEIAQNMWADYQETAPALQEMYQERVTGMVPNGEGGLVRSGNLLDANGSVRTDAGQAMAGVAQAWSAMDKGPIDPNRAGNRIGRLDLLNDRMASGVNAGITTRIGQQDNMLRGVGNVIAMGNGQQAQALTGMQGLSRAAADNARTDAQAAFADASANRLLLGQVAGAGAAIYGHKNGWFDNRNAASGAQPSSVFPVGAAASGYNFL